MNKPLYIETELPADFQQLVGLIKSTSPFLQEHARNVINRDVTVRAWLTGLYIVEYEQKGNDRAQYGEQLLKNLARQLNSKGFSETELRQYRLFFQLYPQIGSPISQYLMLSAEKQQTPSAVLNFASTHELPIPQTVSAISHDGFAMRLQDGIW